MAVFRVERTSDYTVMSNYHLRDKRLSLKAKGLLSQMLSLPEDWDYTLTGLCYINRESKDAIRTAIRELEEAGYIRRRQTIDSGGKFAGRTDSLHPDMAHSQGVAYSWKSTRRRRNRQIRDMGRSIGSIRRDSLLSRPDVVASRSLPRGIKHTQGGHEEGGRNASGILRKHYKRTHTQNYR